MKEYRVEYKSMLGEADIVRTRHCDTLQGALRDADTLNALMFYDVRILRSGLNGWEEV